MKTFLIAIGGALTGVILGSVALFFIAMFAIGNFVQSATAPTENPDRMVLLVDMRDDLDDRAPTNGLEALLGTPAGFVDVVTRIEAAARDEDVVGLVIRGREMAGSSARAEEYDQALTAFKESGKFVIAHTQGIYGSASAYRAFAAADEIWIQPGSEIIATGVGLETLFFKPLLDRLSVQTDFIALYEYKTAMNGFQEADYTDPHREEMTKYAQGIWDLSIKHISERRGLDSAALRTALEAGPMSPEAAMQAGLVDEIGWPEDVLAKARERAGDGTEIVDIIKYRMPSAPFRAPTIAVVGAEGFMLTGESGGSLLAEGEGFASDTISQAILDAARDEKVKAIVFRIDSGGGAATAAEQVWRAVDRARNEFEKPVIISMGTVAASGGYYAAAGADWIVANPSTVTGSIGVLGGKVGIKDALGQIGINASPITIGGEFTGVFSSTDSFSDSQRESYRAFLERGYDRFVEVVSTGRDLTLEEVDARARGRIWTGADALELGLVDELGGILTAIRKAKELAEIEAETEVRLINYPKSDPGLFFTGPMAAEGEAEAVMQLTRILSSPEIRQFMMEVQAARQPQIQARAPAMRER